MSGDAEEPMVYAVRPSCLAADQIEAEHQRLQQRSGFDAADVWEDAVMDAIASLATLPERCPAAPENDLFQRVKPGQTLRALIHKQTRDSTAWRIQFRILSPTYRTRLRYGCCAFYMVRKPHEQMDRRRRRLGTRVTI